VLIPSSGLDLSANSPRVKTVISGRKKCWSPVGTGRIGNPAVIELLNDGEQVTVLDNLSTSFLVVPDRVPLILATPVIRT